jgi:chromosome segregation ATPase
MTAELLNTVIMPILVAVGALVAVIIGVAVVAFKGQNKIIESMANRETARIEADANRTIATVKREEIFNGMVTTLQETVRRVEDKYDALDKDYRKEVQRGNQQEEIIRDLHKQVTELPYLRQQVETLRKQVEGIQESRAQREVELLAANERADKAEAKLKVAEQRITELEAQIAAHDVRISVAEDIIRITPTHDIPAVKVDEPPDENGEAA